MDFVLKNIHLAPVIGNAAQACRIVARRILNVLRQVGKGRHQVDVVPAARKAVIDSPDDFITCVYRVPFDDLERTPTEQGVAGIAQRRDCFGPRVHQTDQWLGLGQVV